MLLLHFAALVAVGGQNQHRRLENPHVCVCRCVLFRFSYTMLPDKSMFSWDSLEVLDAL